MTIEYKEPGTGAIEFAKLFMTGHFFYNGMPIVQKVMEGALHDAANKKIKRCAWCQYFYQDGTKANVSKICSDKCRNLRKAANLRAKNTAEKPKKPTKTELHYYSHYEYSFWVPEYEMLKQSWKMEVSKTPAKLEQIIAAKERGFNGRRKTAEAIEYNGDELGDKGVSVRFVVQDKGEARPVTIQKTTKAEIEAYMLTTYGPEKLAQERRRVEEAKKFKWNKKV